MEFRKVKLILNGFTFQFLFGLLIAVAYVPGWSGASISSTWFLLLLLMPFVIFFYKIQITKSHILGTLFLLYATVSLIWSVSFNISFFFLLQLLLLGIVFCYGSSLPDLKPLVQGMALGVGVSGVVAIAQKFGWFAIFSLNGAIAGLFVNQNMFCEVSVVFFVVLIIFKLYWWLPVTFPGLLLVHSRAAVLAVLICALVWLWARSRTMVYVLVPVLMLFGLLYVLDNPNFSSLDERVSIWLDTARGLTLFGNGVGSFETLFPRYATHIATNLARPNYAHNDLLQLVFEHGIGTIFLLVLIWNISNIKIDERVILYAIGIISLFSFPFHVPILAFTLCLVAGYLTRFDDTSKYIWFFRRPILFERTNTAKL